MQNRQKTSFYSILCAGVVLFLLLALPYPSVLAQDTNKEKRLQQKMESMNKEIKSMQKRMQKLKQKQKRLQKEKKELSEDQEWNTKDISSLRDRMAKAEKHTSKDRVNFSVQMEPKFWSTHMSDVSVVTAGDIFKRQKKMGGSLPKSMVKHGLKEVIGTEEVDVDNDVIRTLKFRLNLNSQITRNLKFSGRLSAYKLWGDSSVDFNSMNQGGLADMELDGNTASKPHGDTIHLERAYFDYTKKFGSVPVNFSLGRRPSTQGPPRELFLNSEVQGSPLVNLINWQFDGASLYFGLEDVTNIPGAGFKLCYGSGYESEYGTTGAFKGSPKLDDVNFYGFIATLYDDWTTKAELMAAYAPDLTDGFTGTTVMPMTVSPVNATHVTFEKNNEGFISRMQPTAEIGDWSGVSTFIKSAFLEDKLHAFVSGAWSHTEADKVSQNLMYNLMGLSLLSSGGDLEDQDGYHVWAGTRYDADYGGKFGLEYNYGSKYWLPLTMAEDNLYTSKLATRGHVAEPYYIHSIVENHFFARLGGQFYFYEHTNSGNPLGEPVDVDDVSGGQAFFPSPERMQQYYLSVVYRF